MAGSSKPAAGGGVSVSTFAAPVIRGGMLVNYVFVDIKLYTADGVNAQAMQSKEPFIRDALVRALHRSPLPHEGYIKLDEAALAKVALTEADKVQHGAFVRAEIKKQTPRRTTGLPAS